MNFSVVVPSKTASNLIPCVDAVRKHEPGARVIVIDDGLDLSFLPKPEWQPPVTAIRGEKPFIFARNVNLGIKRAMRVDPIEVTTHSDEGQRFVNVEDTGVVILNDDALLQTPGGFSMLAKFADEHPEVGCVAPATNITGQRLQWPGNRTPEGYRFVETVPYVCVYIPRRTFDRIGLLDERYCEGYGCEDLDHATAMWKSGLKVAVLYDVFVDHGSLRSSFRGDPKTPKSFAKNYELYKRKWGVS